MNWKQDAPTCNKVILTHTKEMKGSHEKLTVIQFKRNEFCID